MPRAHSHLLSLHLRNSEEDSVLRQRRADPRTQPGNVPPFSEHRPYILHHSVVVHEISPLALVARLSAPDLTDLDQQQKGEHDQQEEPDEGKYRHQELVEGKVAEHGAEVRNGDADRDAKPAEVLQPIGHEREVIEVAVDGCNEHVGYCADVVAVVGVTDAAAGEPAVMVAHQHAHVADAAVVRARGAVTQTASAVRPIGALRHAEGGQVAGHPRTNHPVDVRQRVDIQKERERHVGYRCRGRLGLVRVIVRHHVTGFVPQSQLGTDDQQTERRTILLRPRKVGIAQKATDVLPDHFL